MWNGHVKSSPRGRSLHSNLILRDPAGSSHGWILHLCLSLLLLLLLLLLSSFSLGLGGVGGGWEGGGRGGPMLPLMELISAPVGN